MNAPQPPAPAEPRARRPHLLSRAVSFILGGSRLWAVAFLAAVIASAVGGISWMVDQFKSSPEQQALPKYLPLAVSFVGAFLIGRLVRRFAKTAAVIAALAVFAIGWAARLTTDPATASSLKQEAASVKDRISRAKDNLLSLLPSAAGAAIGAFGGSRRSSSREIDDS